MRGCTETQLTEILRHSGISDAAIAAELASVASHPYFLAGCRSIYKTRKLESLLNVQRSVASLAYSAGAVERRSRVSRSEFLERYYSANRPVILTGMLHNCHAWKVWSPEYLRKVLGNVIVEIMSGRSMDPRYEVNSSSHKTFVPFAHYVDMVTNGEANNDYYLVANNSFFDRPEMKTLYQDIPKFPEYIDESNSRGQVFFWFGPSGTVTPLHHDVMNVLFAQITGRKRFTLISPLHIHHLYNEIGVYSEVDCEHPDYVRFPLYRYVKPLSLLLKPGEVLFVPVGWWHHVRALDISMSLSYTNFVYPNSYTWAEPGIGE
jgi:ribosomal protein L16 Arg81 hydroxylase